MTMARESQVNRRAACILPADCKYVGVDPRDEQAPVYHLKAHGTPCIEGADGIVQRFRNGAGVDTLAEDYGTTRRAIEAAIRTMLRFKNGTRS